MPSCSLRSNSECPREEPCYHHFGTDGDAANHLESRGFSTHRFLIRPPQNIQITEKDKSAICFLINEWDWCYEGPDLE